MYYKRRTDIVGFAALFERVGLPTKERLEDARLNKVEHVYDARLAARLLLAHRNNFKRAHAHAIPNISKPSNEISTANPNATARTDPPGPGCRSPASASTGQFPKRGTRMPTRTPPASPLSSACRAPTGPGAADPPPVPASSGLVWLKPTDSVLFTVMHSQHFNISFGRFFFLFFLSLFWHFRFPLCCDAEFGVFLRDVALISQQVGHLLPRRNRDPF